MTSTANGCKSRGGFNAKAGREPQMDSDKRKSWWDFNAKAGSREEAQRKKRPTMNTDGAEWQKCFSKKEVCCG